MLDKDCDLLNACDEIESIKFNEILLNAYVSCSKKLNPAARQCTFAEHRRSSIFYSNVFPKLKTPMKVTPYKDTKSFKVPKK